MEQTKVKKKYKPRLTKKEKGFADNFIESGNGVQSALKVYDTTDYSTAASISSENLNKPKVKAYLESKAEKAAEFIFQLAESSEVDSVRLNASKDILDRAGFKVPEPEVKPTSTNTYNFLFNTEAQADIRKLEDNIKAKLLNSNDIPKI